MKTFPLSSKTISTERRAFVAGIVNVTSDSFYAKSRGGTERAIQLIEEGADILDLGAESTRPGFIPVPVEEEIRRLVPVIREIRKFSSIPISIDTRKKPVFEACMNEGADILNDVSSFSYDPDMEKFVATYGIPVILTHTFPHGREETLENQTPEEAAGIVAELSDYFEKIIASVTSQGLSENKIIIDPGIGFGKTYGENVELIRNCGKLCDGKYNIMMALSRKRVIGQMMGDMAADRLLGTIEADVTAVLGGAGFVRVHDVAEHVKALSRI